LDFGVNDKETFIIEANDAYALGNYGLPAFEYSKMIESRWNEIFQKEKPQFQKNIIL